ncbi:NF038132 family protein [Massilia sp. Root335]|uniref:NF038132 family protein n=1 Tax=Massilia sp. Root335 TaxID=1736517 RepID=UPI000A9FAAE4|nr:NF038132 family protein [Massilia sp. Root335]
MKTLFKSSGAALFLCVASAAAAQSLPQGWTLSDGGTGGIATAVADLPPSEGQQFAFIDSTGATDLSVTGVAGATTGSALLSSVFSVDTARTLSLDLNFLTNDGEDFPDFAVVQLIDATTMANVATLYTANTTCDVCRAVPAVGGPGDVSAGVSLNPGAAYFDGQFAGLLGGIPYGPGKWLSGTGGATGWVTSSYDLAPGSYQLAFFVGNVSDPGLESALAIDNIRTDAGLIEGFEMAPPVPEPSAWSLLLGGLALLLGKRFVGRGPRAHRGVPA